MPPDGNPSIPACVEGTQEADRGSFLDVRDPREHRVLRVAFVLKTMGLFVLWLLVLAVAATTARTAGILWVSGLTVLGLIAGAFYVVATRNALRNQAFGLAEGIDLSRTEDALFDVLPRVRTEYTRYFLKVFVQRLVNQRRFGETIRIHTLQNPPSVAPVTVAFEPCQVDDVTGDGLCGLSTSGCQDGFGALFSTEERTTLRDRRRSAFWTMVLAQGFLLTLICYETFRAGYPTSMASYLGGVFVIMFGVRFLCRLCRERQWFVVPGGLVQRKSDARRDKWAVHVFDRRTSVLVAYQEQKSLWCLLVADEDAHGTWRRSQELVHGILRAWLSPLEPPTVERLGDLL